MNKSSSIDRMKDLIPSLPGNDVNLAFRLLDTRDFESLQSLVNSSTLGQGLHSQEQTPRKSI